MQSFKLFSRRINGMMFIRSMNNIEKVRNSEAKSWSRLRCEKNTIQNWFLNQIEFGARNNDKELKTEQNSSLSYGGNVSSILSRIQSLEKENDPGKFNSTIRLIDKESCAALKFLLHEEMFAILNKLTGIAPHKVTVTKFYYLAMKELRDASLLGVLDAPQKMVNFIFLMGLKKKAAAKDLALTLRRLSNLTQFSLVEQAIVSTAAFKCGVKFEREKICVIEDAINANIETLITTTPLFVSLLKVLRHGGPSTDFSVAPISEALLKKKERFKISLAVPLLALYAEMLKAETKVVQRLIDDSIYEICQYENITTRFVNDFFLPNEIRIKDVDRMLWAASRLGHKLSEDQLIEVEKFINKKLNELFKKPGIFCGMLISLWIMGYKRFKMVEFCFEKNIFQPLVFSSPKNRARINLLLDCLKLESPEIKIPVEFNVKSKTIIKVKPCQELITVCGLLECLETQFAISETKIDCPVYSLRIYGITTKHRILGWIHVDILNDVTCLRDSKTPHGLMGLKLRLVKAMGYNSILLDHGGLTKMDETVTTFEKCIESLLKESQ